LRRTPVTSAAGMDDWHHYGGNLEGLNSKKIFSYAARKFVFLHAQAQENFTERGQDIALASHKRNARQSTGEMGHERGEN